MCIRDSRYCDGKSCFDEVLLEDLDEYLGNVTKDAFIILHTMGSHGPTYYTVSYTHLDVYKRQEVLSRPALSSSSETRKPKTLSEIL